MNLKEVVLKTNVNVDFFHLEEESENNVNIFTNNYIPKLSNDSKALITFEDNDNKLKGISESALGYLFSVYREKNNSNKLEYIARLNDGSLSMIDYNVANQNQYKYYVFKEDDNYFSGANISDSVETCWWDWSIIGVAENNDGHFIVDTTNIWSFELNLESAETVQNFSKTEYRNLTKFPKISNGKLNYASGGVTCLIGQIRNNKYVDTTEMLEAWNNFCVNGQLKILKDRKGRIMVVDITSSSSKIMDITSEQVNTITFNWTQIGVTDNMTIIE